MKTLLFDFDGTIVDSFELGLSILNNLAHRYKKNDLSNLSTEEIKSMHALKVVQHFGIPLYQLPFFVYKAKIAFNKNIADVKVFPEIIPALNLLKNSYRLAILSSNSEENISYILENNKINFFDFIHSGSSIFGKARSINSALKKNSLSISNVAYIGDEARDIDAAKKLGIPIFSVCWGFNSKDTLSALNPDSIVENPRELIRSLSEYFSS